MTDLSDCGAARPAALMGRKEAPDLHAARGGGATAPLTTPRPMPPFGKATMDGFAPKSTDLAGAGPCQSSCLVPGKDQSRSIRHPA